jgi:hypothetical protein
MASSQAGNRKQPDSAVRPAVIASIGALIVAIIVVAIITKVWAVLIALGALLVVLAVGGAAMGLIARRASVDDPAVTAVPADDREAMPEIFMTGKAGESGGDGEDDTALGDTAEAHDEINPHDLPPDHPGREAAAEEAGDSAGTARGAEHGAADGEDR